MSELWEENLTEFRSQRAWSDSVDLAGEAAILPA